MTTIVESAVTYEATMTSKGQITVPKEVRDELRLDMGDRVYFVRADGGFLFKPKNLSIMDLRGILKRDGPPISDEEAERRLAEAYRQKYYPS
jgi:AbrB family looped-hinge helix DNA binding protein